MVDATRSRPDETDLVIQEEARDGHQAYVLRTVSGADQYLVRSREEALTYAISFAKRHRVRVWLAHGNEATLVEDFRHAPRPDRARTRPFIE